MAKKKAPKYDFAKLQGDLQRQFQNLDPKDPSLWPALPRTLLCLLIAGGVATFLWFFKLSEYEAELTTERVTEQTLRADYQKKLIKAVSLDALKKQREQVQQYVIQLEKQLPSKAEMSALLSDINQAGLGRGLQFELFKPGADVIKEFYAEMPIDVRVTGVYHDLGEFVADLASMPRMVTLNDVGIDADKDGRLKLQAKAVTYRYLDEEELAQQRKAAQAAQAAKQGKK